MPHFCADCGSDEYICQKCYEIFCSMEQPATWRPDITGHNSAGNVCPTCLKKHNDKLERLKKRCKRCGEKKIVTNQGLCYECLDIERQ